VRCFGVATGPYGVEELREAGAVAPDTQALRAVLAEVV
jgi:hypothetical protein